MSRSEVGDLHLHTALDGRYSTMATPTYERPTHVTLTRRQGVASRVIHSSCGARESVAAHGLHRPTHQRHGVRSPVNGGWRFTRNPAPLPCFRDSTKRATQNDFCSVWPATRALDNLNGAAQGARWAGKAGRRGTVGCLGLRYGRPLGGWHSEEQEVTA
jgi:hypothetical protein